MNKERVLQRTPESQSNLEFLKSRVLTKFTRPVGSARLNLVKTPFSRNYDRGIGLPVGVRLTALRFGYFLVIHF
jgi:hypothetical protein